MAHPNRHRGRRCNLVRHAPQQDLGVKVTRRGRGRSATKPFAQGSASSSPLSLSSFGSAFGFATSSGRAFFLQLQARYMQVEAMTEFALIDPSAEITASLPPKAA